MNYKIKTIDCASITWDTKEEGGKAILVSNQSCLQVGKRIKLRKRRSNRVIVGQVTKILESSSIRIKTFFFGCYRTKFTYVFQFKTIENN